MFYSMRFNLEFITNLTTYLVMNNSRFSSPAKVDWFFVDF